MIGQDGLAKVVAGVSAEETVIQGLVKFERTEHQDTRGSFSRIFDLSQLSALGYSEVTHQVNFSRTLERASIRGLHAQPGAIPESKVVTCVRGKIWDVCVDLRKNSPTFLRWEAFELSEENKFALLIPPGCAHGFQTMIDDVYLVYCHSAPYEARSEIGVNPFDPLLRIPWPLEVTALSNRDQSHDYLPPSFRGLEI